MLVVLPTRWPASVDTSQALGYLLARHVPPGFLPEGLRLIREAAGWVPASGVATGLMDVRPATVRSWVLAASEHARVLGPPPGMRELLSLLGDGVIRTADSAWSVLVAAGAGEAADPRILVDFARWCGVESPFDVMRLGPRGSRRVKVYLREATDLVRARTIVDTTVRQYGVLGADRALQVLGAAGVRVEAGSGGHGLREVLGVAGDTRWWWPRRNVATPLTKAMRRIQALGVRIPVEQVPDAVARTPHRRRSVTPGQWPIPAAAIRAWSRGQDRWHLTGEDELRPAEPVPIMHPHDQVIVKALTERSLSWKALHQALVTLGMASPTATAAIMYSPVLRPTHNGYVLLGPEPSNANHAHA
jgi:hypothetical protein